MLVLTCSATSIWGTAASNGPMLGMNVSSAADDRERNRQGYFQQQQADRRRHAHQRHRKHAADDPAHQHGMQLVEHLAEVAPLFGRREFDQPLFWYEVGLVAT